MNKKTLFKLHSWAGLICLVPFLLISFTGSLLVFKDEIDSVLLPEFTQVIAQGERLNSNTLIHNIKSQLPGYELGSWEILSGSEADRIYLIKHGTDEWYKAHLNPYTGKVLSQPVDLHHYLTDWLLQLHYTLLLNDLFEFDRDLGTAFTSIFAIWLMFLGISGLVIYRRFWARVFTLRLDQRLLALLSDVHKMIGTLSSPVLLILGLTGGYYNIAIYVHEWQEHSGGKEHYKVTQPLYNSALDFDAMIKNKGNYIAGFETSYVVMPSEPNAPVVLYGRVPSHNILLSDYASTISFNSVTGELVNAYDIREQSFVPVMVDTFRKLHFGNFAGLLSKVIWCVVGFMPILLGLSGGYLWYKRRGSKRRKIVKQKTLSAAKRANNPRFETSL